MSTVETTVDDLVELIAHESYSVFEKLYFRFLGRETPDRVLDIGLNPRTFSEYFTCKSSIPTDDCNYEEKIKILDSVFESNTKQLIRELYITGVPSIQRRRIYNFLIHFNCVVNSDDDTLEVKARTNGIPEEIPYADLLQITIHMYILNKSRCLLIECTNDTEYNIRYIYYDQHCIDFVFGVLSETLRKFKLMKYNGVAKRCTIKKYFAELCEYIDG
jgi:hypothetical protein